MHKELVALSKKHRQFFGMSLLAHLFTISTLTFVLVIPHLSSASEDNHSRSNSHDETTENSIQGKTSNHRTNELSPTVVTQNTSRPKKYSLSLPMSFYGFSFNEGPDNANGASLRLNPSFAYMPSPFFTLKGGAWVYLNSSRIQDRFILPNQNSTAFLREMVAVVQPYRGLNLKLGALDMEDMENPFLFFRRTFPGADLSYGLGQDRWRLEAGARYAIPTSFSLEFDRTQNEELPSFATAGLKGKVDLNRSLTARARVDYFQFNKLPAVAAFSSQFHGNQATGGLGSARFLYEYRGWAQKYDLDVRWNSRWLTNVALQSVDNIAAPVDRSRSQSIGVSSTYDGTKLAVTPRLSYFYMESDAAPAFYNASYLGHANRVGFDAGLLVNIKRWGLQVYGNFVDSRLLSESINQNDLQYFEIGVEVPNAFF